MDILEIFSDYPNPKAMLKLSKPAPHMGRLPKANWSDELLIHSDSLTLTTIQTAVGVMTWISNYVP